MSRTSARTIAKSAPAVQSQLHLFWTDPSERVCERLMDNALGHDVEKVAAIVGISRRRLNRQRESEFSSTNFLRRLLRIITALRDMNAAPTRYEPIAAAIAEAAGGDFAHRPTTVGEDVAASLLKKTNNCLKESTEVVQSVLRFIEDGHVDAHELRMVEPQIDESLAELHSLKALLRAKAERRTVAPTRARR